MHPPLFLNTPTFSSVKLYQNAILHIRIMDAVFIAMVFRIALEVNFLVLDAVALAGQFVIPGEAFI